MKQTEKRGLNIEGYLTMVNAKLELLMNNRSIPTSKPLSGERIMLDKEAEKLIFQQAMLSRGINPDGYEQFDITIVEKDESPGGISIQPDGVSMTPAYQCTNGFLKPMEKLRIFWRKTSSHR